MCQSNYLEISRAALRRNAAAVREAIPVPVIGVVKCNGYGVTIHEAAAAWQAAGVTVFGVSRPEEALALRRLGFREDILLLCPVADTGTLAEILAHNIILTVSGSENARFYAENAAGHPIRAHIAIDTGMGRFGICWKDAGQVKAVYGLPGFSFEGIYSHFSRSFAREYAGTKQQLERFLHLTGLLQAEGYPVGTRHIANSCAALRFPETRLDAVRIGSALVGRLPVATPVRLERVGTFKAQVTDRKRLKAGDTTGYGSYCKLKHPADAVIVAVGREDGFGSVSRPDRLRLRDLAVYLLKRLREWRHPPCVQCKGYSLRLIGRIGNQYTLFDTAGADIRPGDTVEWEGDLMLSACERRFL